MENNVTSIVSGLARRICDELATFDVTPAEPAEFQPARALAARLIGQGIVSVAGLRRVHDRTGAGLFLAREAGEITGVLAFVLLNVRGLGAVLGGDFDAQDPHVDHIAGPGQAAQALYGWGVAAATKPAAQRLLGGASFIGKGAVAHLSHYARPVTEAGQRLMRDRMGFQDVPGAPGLVWAPSHLSKAVAA